MYIVRLRDARAHSSPSPEWRTCYRIHKFQPTACKRMQTCTHAWTAHSAHVLTRPVAICVHHTHTISTHRERWRTKYYQCNLVLLSIGIRNRNRLTWLWCAHKQRCAFNPQINKLKSGSNEILNWFSINWLHLRIFFPLWVVVLMVLSARIAFLFPF